MFSNFFGQLIKTYEGKLIILTISSKVSASVIVPKLWYYDACAIAIRAINIRAPKSQWYSIVPWVRGSGIQGYRARDVRANVGRASVHRAAIIAPHLIKAHCSNF